ncbi:globin [Sandarakinorhabdus sp.]|uniref:globin n=1 Tax=Sandarakinorhabdus sp. TaxID=1916663 RepID=UPI00286E1487|nr:globin [Sandarakinorhabdus sp.]
MTDRAALIEASFAAAIAAAGDPVPLVYARLFAMHPGMEAEFWRDRSGAIRGEMLTRVFEAIMDMAGPQQWARLYIESEAVTHDNYGISRHVFADFFPLVAATIRDAAGSALTPAMVAAWDDLLSEVSDMIAQLPGSDTPQRVHDVEAILPTGVRGISFPAS